MNSFFNKKLSKLIIIPIIIVILFNCVFPTFSTAYEGMGGTLFKPIRDLVCGVGDVILNVLQYMFMPDSPTAIDKRSLADLAVEEAWKERRISQSNICRIRRSIDFSYRYSFVR